jgi:hypothetical protein
MLLARGHGFSRTSRLVQLGGALAVLTATGTSAAEAPRSCLEAVERGQSLRDQTKLRQARAAFLTCAADPCPAVIQHDCAQWVNDVNTRIPTVILTATDPAGHDLVDVRVWVDGEPFATRLDGIAVPIDPGVHVFRFESANAAPLEQQAVVREAEKYQGLHVVIHPAVRLPPPRPPPPSRPVESPATSTSFPVGAAVAASAGAVATGFFATFGILSLSYSHQLHSTCAPGCSASQKDTLVGDVRATDVSLGIGVVAFAVATWLYLEWRAPTAARGASSAVPIPLGIRF